MTTKTLADKSGADLVVDLNLSLGRQNAASTRSVNLSNEDKAALDAIVTAAQDTTTDSPVAVHQPCDVVTFTPTLDTSAYASGDVLFSTTAVSLSRANDKCALLLDLSAIDKAKQNAAITICFYSTNVTSAAANAANNMSDSDQANLLGSVSIVAADWKTWANNSTLCYSGSKGPNLLLKPATGTTNVYAVGYVDAGTPTFAASDLVFKLAVVQQ